MEAKQYRIYGQIFNGSETLFMLQSGSSELIEKSAREISIDKNLINSLNPNDAYIIGYVFASERALTDISGLIQEEINCH